MTGVLVVGVVIVVYLTYAVVRGALIVARMRRLVVRALGEDNGLTDILRWEDFYLMDRAYLDGQTPDEFVEQLIARWRDDGYTKP